MKFPLNKNQIIAISGDTPDGPCIIAAMMTTEIVPGTYLSKDNQIDAGGRPLIRTAVIRPNNVATHLRLPWEPDAFNFGKLSDDERIWPHTTALSATIHTAISTIFADGSKFCSCKKIDEISTDFSSVNITTKPQAKNIEGVFRIEHTKTQDYIVVDAAFLVQRIDAVGNEKIVRQIMAYLDL